MLKTLRDALKIKEIRQRLFYTFCMIVLVRLGSQIPLPGTTAESIASVTEQFKNGAFGFFDALTGGSFENKSLFALNITPYITSSIIMQLLTIAIPKLEEMQKDGEEGRKKITEITRYLTIALALIEGTATAISLGNIGLFGAPSRMTTFEYASQIIVAVEAMTCRSAMLMWMGENITEKGVGNGISIILLINIISRIPSDFANLFNQFVFNASSVGAKFLGAFIIVAVVIVIVAFVVVLQDGQRKIPVQYSKKMQGRKLVGGSSSHIPLKVNTSGVIPIIFAQSLLTFPNVIATLVTGSSPEWTKYLLANYWFNPSNFVYTVGYILYVIMVIGFAYFYTSITFNPMEVANNMKKQGGFIPGIRPGKPTQEYLNTILNYIVFIGVIALIIIATIPIVFTGVTGASVSFGGTSLIIIVGVVIETLKKIESMMLVRNYKGFLTD